MPRDHRHLIRIGKSSGFAIHYRDLGVNQEKMDRWIRRYYQHHRDLLQENLRGPDFNALMGVQAIADGDYRPDRIYILTGVAAYDREKKNYMKALGLARNDDVITQNMLEYIRILESGGNKIDFLRGQAMKVKLSCPQARYVKWTPRQNGYAHYRIRPLVMMLYAVRVVNEFDVVVNTDDIVLSAFRFFTPREQVLVDENFMMNYVGDYFERKRNGRINYQQEFERMMDRVETDLGEDLRHGDPYALERKCRNAGNEAYCAIIFMRYLGLVDAPKSTPGHWSCTQQAYEDTWAVPEYNTLTLTGDGETFLNNALVRVPIWHKDIEGAFGRGCFTEIEIINRLSLVGEYSRHQINNEQIDGLEDLGIELVYDDDVVRPARFPVFDLQYDMP